jgi:adenine-specific DNA methylase
MKNLLKRLVRKIIYQDLPYNARQFCILHKIDTWFLIPDWIGQQPTLCKLYIRYTPYKFIRSISNNLMVKEPALKKWVYGITEEPTEWYV